MVIENFCRFILSQNTISPQILYVFQDQGYKSHHPKGVRERVEGLFAKTVHIRR